MRGPIPQPVIESVLEALRRFKITCADFGVPEMNIKVLATEATRTAVNSEDYRRQIKEATGWEVAMLAKEMEGSIGAMGVASSFQGVEGLVMDLGGRSRQTIISSSVGCERSSFLLTKLGGSTQITWMISKDGEVQTSPNGSFSFPYGAAALTRKLDEVEARGPQATEQLAAEMKSNFSTAYRDLNIPASLHTKAEQDGGFTLYLSGGGFRGWGHLLMSQSAITPYPIPIINGFRVSQRDFQSITQVQNVAAKQDIFRVSKRRAAQVPAVAFLVNLLCLAIPNIKEIRFCQGGVREGFLFDALDKETKAMDPLTAASARYASLSSAAIAELLLGAIPPPNQHQPAKSPPPSLTRAVLRALSSLLYLHSSLPKESASLAALYCPITGALVSAHGISHTDRALLALMLCQRWPGELPPPHESLQDRLRQLLSREEVWWCKYLGEVAGLVGEVYPAGRIDAEEPRLKFQAEWAGQQGRKGSDEGIRLAILTRKAGDPVTVSAVLAGMVQGIEHVGKKKHWIGGSDGIGFGIGIRVEVRHLAASL